MELQKLAVMTVIMFSAGCGAGPESDWATVDGHTYPVSDCANGKYRCNDAVTSFAPTAELVAPARAALKRIIAATGRDDLVISSDGLPIVVSDEMTHADGGYDCGETIVYGWAGEKPSFPQRIQIDTSGKQGCPTDEECVLHEMIHALSTAAEHSKYGVFAPGINSGAKLNASSLEKLCEGFGCAVFQAE